MEEGLREEPLQELIEGSFEKPIELQEAIEVASESIDVIQEQTSLPEPPSQPQIQTEKSKPQSEQYPKQQSEQQNKPQSEQQPHSLLDIRIPKPRAPFPTRIQVKI